MEYRVLRKYGASGIFTFDLYEVDGVDKRVDAAHASGDTKLMKNEGAEANTAVGFIDEGQGYSITLSEVELQCARGVIHIVDSATKVWLDTSIHFETYGHASAQHAFDLDTATQSVTVSVKTGFSLAATGLDAISQSATGMVEIAKAIWDRVLTGAFHNINNSAGKRLRQVEESFVQAVGTIATVTNGHTFTLDSGAVATTDYYLGSRLEIIEGTGAGQSRLINRYTSGRVVTLDSDFTTNPDTSSIYEIVAADVHVSLSDADLASGFVATYTNTTTITLDVGAVATTDYYVGTQLIFTHGTGAGQKREITGYTSGRVATMSPALVTALDTTTVWHIAASVSIPEIANEVWDEVISKAAHNVSGSAAKFLRHSGDLSQIDGAISDASPNTTDFDTNLTQIDTYFDDALMVFSNGSANAGIGQPISAYLNANGNMTFLAANAWPVTPVNGDDFVIYAIHSHPVAEIQSGLATSAALATVDTEVGQIKAITDVLPDSGALTTLSADAARLTAARAAVLTDWINDGRLDLLLDAIPTTAMRGTDNAATETKQDIIDGIVDSILALLDDARAEPGQGALPVNPDLATKIDYLYKVLRNKTTESSSEFKVYADDETTVDHKAAVSDDGSIATKGEIGTGA